MSSSHPRNAPTMAEVAAAAGVSHQTVSRVINGITGVRAETRQRVEEAVKELGYRRNQAARALVTQRSGLIGVIAVGSFLYGPTSTLATIEKSARQHEYLTLLATISEIDGDQFTTALNEFLDQGVEAVVVIAARERLVRFSSSLDLNIPIVVVGPRPDDLSDLLCVSVEQYEGARMAVDHLVELGHSDIALVSGPRHWVDSQQRLHGALAACEVHGIHPRVFSGDWSPESGHKAGHSLAEIPADRRPTAVFTANDQMALGLIGALRDHGIDLPREMSIVGFDDIPEAAYFSPSLTTVRQDFETLGARVMSAVISLLNGTDADLSPVIPTLIIRHSTTHPAN